MERVNRIRGSLLAGACGDALGYQVEFDSAKEIRRRFGAEGVREMDLRGGFAIVSDDTQMTLFTAEGLLNSLRHGMDMPACVYQSYLDWLHTQGYVQQKGCYHAGSMLLPEQRLHIRRAPGNTCLSALLSGDMGDTVQPINNSKGCGGVMRTAPCGMVRALRDVPAEDAYALQGAAAAAITHGHRMGYVPAAMLADLVHGILLEDGRTLQALVEASLDRMCRLFAPEIRAAEGCEADDAPGNGAFAQLLGFRSLMNRAIALAKTDTPPEEAIGQLGEGWVGDEALAIAVYCCLRFPDSMEECLCAAVTHKGDSDSTGAIAGNILGAWLGAEAIPRRWLDALEMRELMERMACQLSDAAREDAL
ncbi:MAG: ADP-ribosylglycohydrolase family protein [Aristaeellaceae bacterium]